MGTCTAWPGNRFARKVSPITDKAGGRWPVIHYVYAQTKKRWIHATGDSPLLMPPTDSSNLEAWVLLTRYQIAATAAHRRWQTTMTIQMLITLLAVALLARKTGVLFTMYGQTPARD